MAKSSPKSLAELRLIMCDTIVELRNDKIDPDKAKALCSCADMIIKTVKCQLDMYKLTKEAPNIAFLESKETETPPAGDSKIYNPLRPDYKCNKCGESNAAWKYNKIFKPDGHPPVCPKCESDDFVLVEDE